MRPLRPEEVKPLSYNCRLLFCERRVLHVLQATAKPLQAGDPTRGSGKKPDKAGDQVRYNSIPIIRFAMMIYFAFFWTAPLRWS